MKLNKSVGGNNSVGGELVNKKKLKSFVDN